MAKIKVKNQNSNRVIHCLLVCLQSQCTEVKEETRIVQRTIKAHVLLASKIPEDPGQLRSVLAEIEQRNLAQAMGKGAKWPTVFTPNTTHCKLCSSALTPLLRLPGSDGRSYLLSRAGFSPVSVYIQRCTNCSARYSYSEWKDGNENVKSNMQYSILTECTKMV